MNGTDERRPQRSEDELPIRLVLVALVVVGALYWLAYWPPSKVTAPSISGVVTRQEPITRPNGSITENDVLVVSTPNGPREIFLRRQPHPLGTIIAGKAIIARIDRNSWIMSLEIDGQEVIPHAPALAAARRWFWGQAAIGTVLAGILLLIAIGRRQQYLRLRIE